MTAIQTPFASQSGRYSFLGSMALENAFMEMQGEGGKARYVVLPTDGMVALSDDTGSQCRGSIYMDDLDVIYSVHSSSVWKVTQSGTLTRIGTIPGIDKVQITRNKKATPQITVLCDAGLYYIEEDQIRIINDQDLPSENPVSLATLGEFTLLGYDDGRVFYSTQGETTEYDALDFFTAEQSPDKLRKMVVDRGELFLFSAKTTEVWTLTAIDPDAPFTFRTLIQKGIKARDAISSLDGTLMWVGNDEITYRLEGYTPKRISVNEVERLVHRDAAIENLIAFSWSHEGHSFLALKGTNWTRVFDAATGYWHSRKSRGLTRWRAQYSTLAWNKAIVGDELSGKIFYLDPDTYTEDGDILVWTVVAPAMHTFPNRGVVDRLSIDFLVGSGVTSATAQGYDPLLMVSKSTDGGSTFSNPRHVSLGRQGQYSTRVNTWRWGQYGPKGVVWKLSVSDPIGRGLALIDAAIRPMAA